MLVVVFGNPGIPPAGVFNLADAAFRGWHASPVISSRLAARGLRVDDREPGADR